MTAPIAPQPVTPESPGLDGAVVMRMDWRVLTAIHWRVDPAVVARRLPDGLRVDTFDGSAWVGLIPFQMRDVRLAVMPRGVPWIGTFPETNIRTYVIGPEGRRGVWFDSLDITRAGAVTVARLGYRIPYHWSSMALHRTGNAFTYRATRRWQGDARSFVRVRVGDRVPPDAVSDLDHWLTARWCFFADGPAGILRADVHHERWSMHRAELLDLDDDFAGAAGYDVDGRRPDHVAFSPGVDVSVGLPVRVG